MTTHIITIDGPSGSGKGTLATQIARHYQYHLLDSGALYRLLGLALLKRNKLNDINNDLDECVNIALTLEIEFKTSSHEGTQIFLEEQNVTQIIRTEEVGTCASKVAAIPALRDALLERQRIFLKAPGLVADGRDMGTVVFPNACAKIYLTASAQARAQRRVSQLQTMGLDVNMNDILANIETRDKRDTEREISPLKPATDALIIDSSSLSIEQVFDKMVSYIDSKLA